ncbi:MAG: hypothetical protein HWE27_17650 [Gammaproteobacteria bacterium]|nr:hypothetical protein [Gammaproteobacteria bacterium]
MKKLITILSTILSINLFAGSTFYSEVGISGDAAWGSMVGARKSDDNVQYIGCSVYGNNSSPYIVCRARSAAGDRFHCRSSEQHFIDQIYALDSQANFYMQREGEICSLIYTGVSSTFTE